MVWLSASFPQATGWFLVALFTTVTCGNAQLVAQTSPDDQAGAGAAQSTSGSPSTSSAKTPSPIPVEKESTLLLLAHTDSRTTNSGLEKRLLQAIKSTRSVECDEILVQTISHPTFVMLTKIVTPAAAPVGEATGGARIQHHPTLADVWQIELPSAYAFVNQLKLTIGDRTRVLKPAARTDRAAPLRFFAPGLYLLHLDAQAEMPDAYELGYRDQEAGGKTVAGTWPTSDRHFLVQLKGFAGDRGELYAALQQSTETSPPLKQWVEGPSTVISVLRFVDDEAKASGTTNAGEQ